MTVKNIVERILKIKAAKVTMVIVNNVVQTVSPKAWKMIEHYFYNPYDFTESNIPYFQGLYEGILRVAKTYDFDIKGKKLLEIGPGGFLGVGAFLKREGLGEYSVLDSVNHFEKLDKKTVSYYKSISDDFVIGDTFDPKYLKVLSYTNGRIEAEDASFDITYSNAVYEHIDNPGASIEELSRVTKQGGMGIHQIDYRDHIFDQKSVFYLTLPDWLFASLFKNSEGWTNRKRHSFFREAFMSNGFEILEERTDLDYHPESIQRYSEKLKNISKEDLPISSGFFVVRKK